ncbi:MAG: phytanoyl-CoA dioxygenase family protein [Anaerolineaceae bacterium]|nr:phytanoyl-CoA dioxygenase family protein [Anaerolineaceae bacterium]
MPAYFSEADINIDDFKVLCSQQTDLADYPNAQSVAQNILIYDGQAFRTQLAQKETASALKRELARALKDGPGVLVIKAAYEDLSVIDRTTVLFREIVEAEKAGSGGKGDHFGANERIWNSIQKACVKDPDLFIDYYSNPIMATACEAWLGPYYRITAQMNNVKPGNKAQSVHRDYHLGFQSSATTARFPAHAQVMSQYLTLQGAIAHVDMPLAMGPTVLLPYSQQFEAGYLAYSRPEFIAYFNEHCSQLPLEKGDMVFFSPALFHGAGENVTQVDRLANLIQISSALGRTMETLNNHTMIAAVYPALLARVKQGAADDTVIENTIAAVADGYSFPTNLDLDPPIGGNAPETQQDMMRRAVAEQWSLAQLQASLEKYAERRQA